MKLNILNIIIIGLCIFCIVTGCKPPIQNEATAGATPTPVPSTSNVNSKTVAAKTNVSPAVDPKDIVSDIKWKDFDNIFNVRSNSTDMQKESAWKGFEGKRVEWTGEVKEVSKGILGGLTLNIKMNPETLVMDVSVTLRKDQEAKASQLTKGRKVTFAGTLSGYGGAVLPTRLDDGEIK